MTEPLISIIIPHYNSPDSLCRLIESIGIHDNVEILVIDDRSDRFVEEYSKQIKRLESEKVRFFSNDNGKKGAGTCRNIGLKNARGEWLLFADADDYFTGEWFKIVSDYLNSDYDIVYFKPTSIYLDSGEIANRHLPYSRMVEVISDGSRRSNVKIRCYWGVPWSKMIRKDLVTKNDISFDEVRYSNDLMFSAKTGLCANKITCDNRTIYVVTDQENTLTKSTSQESFFIRLGVACERHKYLKSNLPKEDQIYIDDREGARRIRDVIERKYGLKALAKCITMLIKAGYPLYAKRS